MCALLFPDQATKTGCVTMLHSLQICLSIGFSRYTVKVTAFLPVSLSVRLSGWPKPA